MAPTVRRIATVVKWLGWLVPASIIGSLVTALTSGGWLVLVLASAATLVAAAVGPRLADRWPALRGRLMWASLALAGLAVLVESVRNTPFGLAPVRWISVVLGLAGLIVAAIGVWRYRQSRWWLALAVTAAALIGVTVDGFWPLSPEAVEVTNGEVQLSGTLFLPRGDGPFPLVVFAHGAGAEPTLVSYHMADRLAREGIAALTWDKRGSGASRGGSPFDPFEELASDIEAWVTAMRARIDIAGDRVAIWGWSEGGWPGPLAAANLGDVTAMVLISPGMRRGDANLFERGWRMRAAGVAEDKITEATDLRRRLNQHYSTGEGRSELIAQLVASSEDDWYAAAVDAGMLIDPDELLKPGSPEAESWIQDIDFSVLDPLSQFTGPVFVAVGLEDRCNPPLEVADEIEQALQRQGNDHRVMRYPGASHLINVWLSAPQTCNGFRLPPVWYPRGYVDEVVTWLEDVLQP